GSWIDRAFRPGTHRGSGRCGARRVPVPLRRALHPRGQGRPGPRTDPGAALMERVELDALTFGDRGLLPAIVQGAENDQVLMMAWMSWESVERTLDEGRTVFWSRSRYELWRKGGTGGHCQHEGEVEGLCGRGARSAATGTGGSSGSTRSDRPATWASEAASTGGCDAAPGHPQGFARRADPPAARGRGPARPPGLPAGLSRNGRRRTHRARLAASAAG